MDTIFAPATARGKAGVAVIRLSGPSAWAAVETLAGTLPAPRHAALRVLRAGGAVLDEALVLLFEKGASFTGEESAELQVHGSVATVSAVIDALTRIPGLRMAEAGEFTRRALENGRMDLAQVEGLADLIEAETEAQRRQAQAVLSGAVGARAEDWRRSLIRAAALVEASIDFADEDVPTDVLPEVSDLIGGVARDLRHQIAGYGASERIREGFEVAIVGRPNAGKSTLLNALAGREAAITSAHAGTTRDVIEVRMDVDGLAVTLLDTAGLRATEDEVEAIGIDRAVARAAAADLRLFLLDEGEVPLLTPRDGDLLVRGKADLVAPGGRLSVSGKTGAGIPELLAALSAELRTRVAGSAVITRARHRSAVTVALGALESAANEVRRGPERMELIAEHIRTAVRALDSLVGRIDVEDLLDEIFASFCIGK